MGLRTVKWRPPLKCALPHHIVHVLPVIEGNQLERGQHGPHEIIEARVAVVGILADAQARVTCIGRERMGIDWLLFIIRYYYKLDIK